MSATLAYYNANAEDFAASTVAVDFSSIQNRFAESLKSTIVPLYQIALNQGFTTWECGVVDHRKAVSERYEIVGLD